MTIAINVPVLVDAVLQCVAALTLLAFWIVMRWPAPWQRWGNLLGFLCQPVWLYVHWHAGQYGMLLVAVLFTVIWLGAVLDTWPAIARVVGWKS